MNQTISGLACGKPIRGNVAFLGGPLHFLSELRASFIRTLNLGDEQIIAPSHSHLFAAVGAAMNSEGKVTASLESLMERLSTALRWILRLTEWNLSLKMKEAYAEFTRRHESHNVRKADISTYEGNCYLGIDAGSTTTKVALVSEDGTPCCTIFTAIITAVRWLPQSAQ